MVLTKRIKNSRKELVIFGAGDQALMAWFLFSHDSDYVPVAFTVDSDYITTNVIKELPVVQFEEVERYYPPSDYIMFIALGYKQMNNLRATKCMQAKSKGYSLASYVSTKATLWADFGCGENCLILEQNNIQPFVTIGNNVTMWSGNHIGHHSHIDDNVFITSHVVVSGRVSIGKNCFLGVNSTIRDKTVIRDKSFIGAGAVVTHDTEPCRAYVGNPARMLEKGSFEIDI